MSPKTKYAKAPDGVHLAYQVVGEGPTDIVFVMGWTTNIEAMWREPALEAFLTRLSSMGRLILFDRRGLGLSDRIAGDVLPTLETRMDDVRVVMDAVGSTRAAVMGVSEGGPLSILFAATHPDRTSSLVLFGTMARFGWAEDFPWGQTDARLREELDRIDRLWGTEELAARELREWAAPSAAGDARLIAWLAEYTRSAASPGAAMTLTRMNHDLDVRDALSAVHVPTLVLGRREDRDFDIAATRQLAAGIRGAELIEFPGDDHFFWMGDAEGLLVAIEGFLRRVRDAEVELDRMLATVVFTDVVGSTEHAARVGDRVWTQMLAQHHERIRALLGRFRGREIDTAGDGFLATFDGPIRAARCALEATDAVRDVGLAIRAGLHTGEVEFAGDAVRGIAVHVGARIAALAGPSEVLASSTVRDLVAGSSLTFDDAGEHELKGVPGSWHVYRVKG